MTGLPPYLLDVSIRSAALALVAVALFRIRALRTATWAHAIWTVVLLGMLFLFFLGPVFTPIPLRILPVPPASVAEERTGPIWLSSQLARETTVPSSEGTIPAPSPRRSLTAGAITVWIYLAVAIALFSRLLIGSWLAHRLLAASVRAGETFYESSQITVPLTIGWLRPVILLPVSWRTWGAWKLEAVLLHERAHVQRHDSLISLLAGFNHCLFWFHPLAWWLERKLAFLAERACDEACVCKLENRVEYARLLVEMAGAVEASHGRLYAHSLSMARPSQIHQRVDAILEDNHIAPRGLNAFSWVAALSGGIAAVSAAGSIRIEPKVPPPPVHMILPAAMPAPLAIPFPNPAISPIPSRKPVLTAQAPMAVPSPQPPEINAQESQIVLPVSVLDPYGRSVAGLEGANFRITEGPDARPITAFNLAEGQHVIAVLNTVGASGEAMDALRQALDPRDEYFTGDGPSAANTEPFLERIAGAVSEVKQKQNPVKAVVVIMQGGRNIPLASEKNVANILRLAVHGPRVAIFFTNIEDISQAVLPSLDFSQQDDLRILADATGGMVVPVARPEEITSAIKRIGAMLRYQYLLSFAGSKVSLGFLAKPSIEIVKSEGLPRLQVISPQVYGQ